MIMAKNKTENVVVLNNDNKNKQSKATYLEPYNISDEYFKVDENNNIVEEKENIAKFSTEHLLAFEKARAKELEKSSFDFNNMEENVIKKNEAESIIPSSTTMQFFKNIEFEDKEEKNKVISSINVSKKGKMVILGYAIAIVAFLVMIILNSAALATLSTGISKLNGEVKYLESYNASLSTNLDSVSNEEYILSQAKDFGMTTSNGEVKTISLPTKKTPNNNLESTNWFDKLCLSIEKIFN